MKKLSLLLALVLCVTSFFTACDKQGIGGAAKTGDEASANPTKYEVIKEAQMPSENGVTLSLSDMEAKYRPHTDWRIYQIRTTQTTVKPAEGGTAYYVSNNGDDSADGTSPEKAIKTLANIGKLPLKAGDVVYLERGSIFRGQLIANKEGVTFSAYGEGRKPEIYASLQNAAKEEFWEETDTANVWLYSEKTGKDIGNIIFNQGEEIGIKAIVKKDGTASKNATTGKAFKDYKDLDENFHFFHAINGKIYLYYDKGNPGKAFSSIEISPKENIAATRAKNITYDNLCFKYTGAHAVASGSNEGLTVQNCEFAWIGGSIFEAESATRYGNAVEIYGWAKNFTVDNCYFYQIFDTGATFQYNNPKPTEAAHCDNIKFTNSVYEYCNWAMEYFLTAGDASNAAISNFLISGNLCWYAGQGLCEQRVNKSENSHIKSWTHNNYISGPFNVTNNLFCLATNMLFETYCADGTKATFDNNIYIQTDRRKIGRNGKDKTITERFNEESVKRISGDKNAKIITVER